MQSEGLQNCPRAVEPEIESQMQNQLQSGHSTYLHNGWTLKFFESNASHNTIPYGDRWSWPFLDVFLLSSDNEEKDIFR